MKDHYDIAVVGAGPAGSTFARIAAQHGLDVVVFDKRKEIGNPVRCGEALGISEPLSQNLELPRWVYSTEVLGAKLYAPDGKSITWADENTRGYILERKMFDKWLAELAVEKGAVLKVYHNVIDIRQENGFYFLKVSHGGREPFEVKAKVVVSAEGIETLTARKLGFPTVHRPYDVDTCYEYEMYPYEHENLIELFFGERYAPRGYVWIFPKEGKKANVGVGIGAHLVNNIKRGGIKGADPKFYIDLFIEENEKLKESSSLLDFGGVISVGAPLSSLVKGNALVIGTAAKQVDPIHGGGIGLAMQAGYLSGLAVSKAFEENKISESFFKKEYEEKWKSTIGDELHKRLLLRKSMEKLNDDDLNFIFSELNKSDLEKIMSGNFKPTVSRLLKGRPSLLKVLSALIS